MSKSEEIPDDLGVELVGIMYKNTTLNFDVCAMNLVEILQHLSTKLPELENVSNSVITTIQDSLKNKEVNPDLNILENNLKILSDTSSELNSGELNFYECNQIIEKSTERCIELLSNQTQAGVFNDVLKSNRDRILSFFVIWQLATSRKIKNNIVDLFNICSQTDPVILQLLTENTNLTSELCFKIKQDIELKDCESLDRSCKCLINLISNTQRMQLSFIDFLKTDDFLRILFEAIESEKDYLFIVLKQEENIQYNDQKLTMIERFIHLLLCINKKFMLPEENLILDFINKDPANISNRKFLGETIINLFNFERDPLLDYQLEIVADQININENSSISYYVNSVLKFVSDLFSISVTRYTTSIFYSNDFNVLIDISLRKLNSLGPDDQIRVDYLSLIQLIIENSEYMDILYRQNDIKNCFNAILGEKDQYTIDQDIVRIIFKQFPALQN